MIKAPELLKIGAFAKLAGTNLRTLRYYEEVGLLQPSARSKGGFRYYRKTDLNRVELVKHLQDLGLTLDEIHGLIKERNSQAGRAACMERVGEALRVNKELLDARMHQMNQHLKKIEEATEKHSICENCDVTPSVENNYCEPCEKTGACLPDLLSGLY